MDTLHGPPVAISDFDYGSDTIKLNPGDCLLMYTDGVTEAMDPKKQEFGDARLREFLGNTGHDDLRTLIGGLMLEVKKFAAGEEQSDDITILAVRYGAKK
jgi:sigma-B regulation protein RsbU (phosphoserine phosphatase)